MNFVYSHFLPGVEENQVASIASSLLLLSIVNNFKTCELSQFYILSYKSRLFCVVQLLSYRYVISPSISLVHKFYLLQHLFEHIATSYPATKPSTK